MHFSVLLISNLDAETVMAKYHNEANENDGAEVDFTIELTEKNAKEDYKNFIKQNPEMKKEYPTLESYMETEYSHLTKETGGYGYFQNIHSLYDWYEVGGRWSNLLPKLKDEKEIKRILKNALDLKNKKIAEKYRDDVEEYIKIKSMPPKDAVQYLKLDGQNELIISEDFSAKDILNFWKNIQKREWHNFDENDDVTKNMINTIIISEEGEEDVVINEGDENINDDFFIEQFNKFLKKNKKVEDFYPYSITVLDLHN